MTYLQHFLAIQDPEIRRRIIHNYFAAQLRSARHREVLNANGRETRDISSAVGSAFDWDATEEGSRYWMQIHDRARTEIL